MNLQEFCLDSKKLLQNSKHSEWASNFVDRRMQLQRLYLKGLILSTVHGADIFDNILNCLNGKPWEEKGELGNNFRKLIEKNL